MPTPLYDLLSNWFNGTGLQTNNRATTCTPTVGISKACWGEWNYEWIHATSASAATTNNAQWIWADWNADWTEAMTAQLSAVQQYNQAGQVGLQAQAGLGNAQGGANSALGNALGDALGNDAQRMQAALNQQMNLMRDAAQDAAQEAQLETMLQRDLTALREREAAIAKKRKSAHDRARQLLLDHLDEKQTADFLKTKKFVVHSRDGQRIYEVGYGVAGNVHLLDAQGRKITRLCIHPQDSGELPIPDVMLAQKLMLDTDENSFLRIANQTLLVAQPPPVAA